MTFRTIFFLLAIGLYFANPTPVPAQQPAPVHIAVSAHTVSWFPLYVGWKKGIFKEHGIDIRPVQMSVRTALAGLAAKQIPYMTSIGSSMHAITQGLPAKIIMIFAKRSHFVLIANHEITSLKQLKGKHIAISQPGNTVHRQLNALLKKFAIEPSQVKVVNLGRATNRALALTEGNVDAAMLHIPYDLQLQPKGFRPLAYLKDVFDIPLSGIVTHDSRMREKPEEVKQLLTGALKSIAYTKSHGKEVMPLLAKFIGLDDLRMAHRTYELITGIWPDDGMVEENALRRGMEMADVAPNVPLEKIFSFATVKRTASDLSVD